MIKRYHTVRGQRGMLLVAAIVMIVMIAAMLVAMAYISSADVRSGSDQAKSDQAIYVAGSGVEYAKGQVLTGTACGAGLNITAPVGPGSFSITSATQYAHTLGSSIATPTNTAAGGVSATATTIPVVSTAGYAPFGRIVIDSEEIYYNAISGNNFINAVRGYGNTVAATHGTVTAVPVIQGLCNIQSTGTVGSAMRSFTANVPVQLYKTGVITKAAATGNQGYTGVGFKPNVVIFYWTEQAATGTTANGVGVSSGVGFATGPNQQYVASVGMRDNNTNTGNVRRSSASNVIIFHTVTVAVPTLLAQASLVSMDSDGFTLNWTTNINATAYRINYIAIGGETTGYVGNFTMNAAVTASQSVTGTGFKPDFLMFLHAGQNAADAQTLAAQFGIGFAQNANAHGSMVYGGETALGTSSSRWQQLTNRVILFLTHAAPPLASGQGDFTSMDANGFTINVTNAGLANQTVGYLALRGARVGVGTFNQPSAAGAQTPVSSLTFKPNGVMLVSRNLATAATLAAGRTSIGAGGGSPIVDGNIWFIEQDAAATANANAYNDSTNIISTGTNAATTNATQASLSSLQVGGFNLTWTLADAVAREILYWAIGPRNFADVTELVP